MNEFDGKVALITGAGRGLGRAIAMAFASLGAAVAANDINPISLEETVRLITQAGGIARPYVFDIAKSMPIEGMIAQVLEHYGKIDILINHAAVQPDTSIFEMDEWEFHRTLDVNLGGPFFSLQQVSRVMRQQGGGVIINLVSTDKPKPRKHGHAAHLASQLGLLGLTQAAAEELAADHIHVNAVCQGSIAASAVPCIGPEKLDLRKWKRLHPQLWAGDHPDVVSLVLYLCSQESSALNGQIIEIVQGL